MTTLKEVIVTTSDAVRSGPESLRRAAQPRPEEDAADLAREAEAARPLRLYIAGPMTGHPAFNFPVFDAAVQMFTEMIDQAYLGTAIEPVSPAELDDPATRVAALASPDGAPGSGASNGETWGDFLARDVKLIADDLDAVALLPGWHTSKGARLEAFIARHVGKPVFYVTDFGHPRPREDWPHGWDTRSLEFWQSALCHSDYVDCWDEEYPSLVELDDAELDRVFTLADLTTLQKIRHDEAVSYDPFDNPDQDGTYPSRALRPSGPPAPEAALPIEPAPSMRVIGLCGPAGAGKDEVAKMLREQAHGTMLHVKRQGFADKLKLSVARCFFPDADQEFALNFCNDLKAKTGRVAAGFENCYPNAKVTGRQFLQNFGTEAHRDVFGEDFWLDAVLPEGRDDCDYLLIPDVRFENEARRVLDRGGEIWRIDRPDAAPIEAHTSEAGIPDELVTQVIDNSGTLEDLYRAVEAAFHAYERNV